MIRQPPEIGETTDQFFRRLTTWTIELTAYPGFAEWQNSRIQKVLTVDLLPIEDSYPDFEFDLETLKKHKFVLAYMELIQAATALRDTEFYFRRFPFRDFPIAESDHISYICDMLFSRIYQFREKLKKTLNLKAAAEPTNIDIGKTLKLFDKIFKDELKSRNLIHHHERYNDLEIQQISLASLLGLNDTENIWAWVKGSAYKRVRKDWVQRTRHRAKAVFDFLDALSTTLNQEVQFLPVSD